LGTVSFPEAARQPAPQQPAQNGPAQYKPAQPVAKTERLGHDYKELL